MKPTVLTPFFTMCATSASQISPSFCVVLKTQRFWSSIGSTTATVPTGASIGVFASLMNCKAPIAFGEPDGPMIASTFCSSSSFLTSVTVCVESEASSSTMYSTSMPPIFFGSSAALFFCGMPTTAVAPVAEAITPTFICAWAARGRPSALTKAINAAANPPRGDIFIIRASPLIRSALGWRESGHAREERAGLGHLLLHLQEHLARLIEVVPHQPLHDRCLAVQELGPHLGALLGRVVQALALLGQAVLDVGEGRPVLLEVRTHHPLHRMAVETDDLRKHLGREDRHAAGLFFQDDLQQDAAGQVFAALRIAHFEVLAREHHRLHVGQRDVGRELCVVE